MFTDVALTIRKRFDSLLHEVFKRCAVKTNIHLFRMVTFGIGRVSGRTIDDERLLNNRRKCFYWDEREIEKKYATHRLLLSKLHNRADKISPMFPQCIYFTILVNR